MSDVPLYDAAYFETLTAGWTARSEPIISALLRRHGPAPPVPVALDFGGGGGTYAGLLRERASRVECCDVALVAVDQARPLFDHTYRITSSADLPSAAYDLVFSSEVIEHVDDYRATLRDLHRTLRPGGCLFLTTTQYAPGLFTMLYSVKNQHLGTATLLHAMGTWMLGLVSERHRIAFVRRWLFEPAGGHLHGFARRHFLGEMRDAGFDIVRSGVFYPVPPVQLPFLHAHTPRTILQRDDWSLPKRLAAVAVWGPLRMIDQVCRATGLMANNLWVVAVTRPPAGHPVAGS